MPDALPQRWDALLSSFFGGGNQLDWPSNNEVVRSFIEANAVNLEGNDPGPFVLPRVTGSGGTAYYAIALDGDQAHELRRVLAAVVGPTYTTFDGRPVEPDLGDQVLQAAVRFAGSPAWVFTFGVVGSGEAKAAVRKQILLFLALMRRRPRRRVSVARPFGRLVRDFERALSDRDERVAGQLLYGPIADAGRLSNMNRLFLHVRLLAEFERWAELAALPSMDDLLRLERPALVSDALARLAMVQLRDALTADSTSVEPDVFADQVAPRFGSLITSVERIRSALGAQYYVLWQCHQGESPATIRDRLAGLAWIEHPEFEALLGPAEVQPAVGLAEPALEAITAAIVEGRLETALELLSRVTPRAEHLPSLLLAVSQTLSMTGIQVVTRFRQVLGDEQVDQAVAELHKARLTAEATELLSAEGWPERIGRVARRELGPAEALLAAEETGLLELVRDESMLQRVITAVEDAASSGGSGPVLDVALELVRRLTDTLPEVARSRLHDLRLAVLRLWALDDQSGDLTLAGDVLDEVEALLASGCSSPEYEEVVELLALRWEPFLTDFAFGVGVRALELLAAARPASSTVLGSFATPLLARVTRSNVGRLDLADVTVADSLSQELQLGLPILELRDNEATASDLPRQWSGTIGIYSLDESALGRAAAILQRLLPAAEVRTAHDKVASDPLRALAANADIMVVATQKAKHAATDAIRSARSSCSLTFPVGKGTSSLVRAVLDALHATAAALPG